MEQRAVRVSHELWKQIMTQGYTSGGWQCVKGLPEDAQLVKVWIWEGVQPDPVFVFESDSWEGPAEREIGYGENVYPECLPEFRTAECRTCRSWTRDGNPILESQWCNSLVEITDEGFGCVLYEPETE